MTALSGPPVQPPEVQASPTHSSRRVRGSGVWRFARIPEAAIGLTLGIFILAVIILGPFVAPYNPTEVGVGIPGEGPSAAHWLGTDQLGRDVLSRLLTGGLSGIAVPLVAVSLCFLTGGLLGMTAGYLGRSFDAVTTRLIDVLLAIPAILMVLVIMAGFGTNYVVVVIAITIVYIPGMYRILRGATQSVAPREYVLAAKARGEGTRWVVTREILPNIAPTLFVDLALRTVYAVTFFATLSFLGLGAQPPSSNWGVMVSENRGLIFTAPLSVLAPAAAIAILTVSISLIADALTQYLGDETSRDVRL